MSEQSDWRENGVRIVRSHELDSNTPQTPGMTRAAAINHAKVGANKPLGRYGQYSSGRQNRRPPSRRIGKCYLCRQWQGTHALGR